MAYEGDPELNELRRRRTRELKEMQAAQSMGMAGDPYGQAQAAEAQRREAERAELLRRVLTPEARERLGRIRMAKPEVANSVEQQVLSLAASGRLQRQIDDATLRALLERIMPERRDIRITRR
ncbi:MAG: DNA-binding protein [Candidatus Lutacidiplasmatales archaeon]